MMLDPGICVQIACIWEATAPKVGNVHRQCDFQDVTYVDFLLSAAAVAPVLGAARQLGVGRTVLEGVQATRRVVANNTNLGILLLLAPLACVPDEEALRSGVEHILAELTVEDAELVYEAIRLAQPGGMGEVADQDVAGRPTESLRAVMELAADRDLVARQYANGFAEVFEDGVPLLTRGLEQLSSLEEVIVFGQLHLLALHPDTLIARKRGWGEAREASQRARQVLEYGWSGDRRAWGALKEFDGWLRAEGHQRNPGTTADLLTACLFVMLREGTIPLPPRLPWSAENR